MAGPGSLQSFKLGRLPINPVRAAKVPRLSAHALASVAAPPKLDRSALAFTPRLYQNDKLGDCTAVGLANCVLGRARILGYGEDIPEDKVLSFYSKSCGYSAGPPLVDPGGVEVDVLSYQFTHGFDIGAQVPLVGEPLTWDAQDFNSMRTFLTRAGGVYLGLALAECDQAPGVWDTDKPAGAGSQTPGSWGLHCAMAWDYTGTGATDLVRIGTWGFWQLATWRWLRSRLEEAHGILWRQLGMLQGVDYDRLSADMKELESVQ